MWRSIEHMKGIWDTEDNAISSSLSQVGSKTNTFMYIHTI